MSMRSLVMLPLKPLNFGQAFLCMLITSSGALAQRDLPPAQRTDFYNTPCTINGLASWCSVGRVNGAFASLRIEFAHGDRPIQQLVSTSSRPDQWGSYLMRDAITGQLWSKQDHGFTSLIEQGGFSNTICVGPGSRLAYPQGCAQP